MPRKVMPPDEAQAFQAFLRDGLRQYETRPANAGKPTKRKLTALDVYAERKGIQKRFNPLADAGFTTAKRIGKMIENALTRAVPIETARLALFALHISAAAAKWRVQNKGWDADEWDRNLAEHRSNKISWAEQPAWPQEGRDPLLRARVAMLPSAVGAVAAAVVWDLYERKILSKPKMAEASAVVARGLEKRLRPWAGEFIAWVSLGESLKAVGVTEQTKAENGGFSVVHRTISVRAKNDRVDGQPANHSEFLEGILLEIIETAKNPTSKGPVKKKM